MACQCQFSCVCTVVVYIVIFHRLQFSCNLYKIAPETRSLVLLVLQDDKLWKISFAFCLLQELPMRCSALNLVDSGDSPWGRLHCHIQTSCTFHSSHSRAGTKWRLSVYLTLCCLQNVKGLPLQPKLHQIALVPQKTQRQALVLLGHTLAHLKLT